MTLKSIVSVLYLYSILHKVQLAKMICASPQYLELAMTGTIRCNFENNVFAVLWYNETDFENGTPTLRYQDVTKTGPGYESGEFDVHLNGSLVINRVQLRHEGVFTVAYTQSKTDFYVFVDVLVIVVVKPRTRFPIIDECGQNKSRCYAETVDRDMQCLVRGAKPKISLEIVARTLEGDKTIPNDLVITLEDSVFMSRVTTNDVFHYSSLLILIVCKASSPLGMLNANESSILMLNSDFDFTKVKSKPTYVKLKTRLELTCTENTVGFVVWKRSSSTNFTVQYLLLYSVLFGESYMETFSDDVTFENNTSLIIPSTEVKHEGVYFCIFGDGLRDGVSVYNVSVTVPVYPRIEGCTQHPGCAIDAEYEGNLTCTVKGIRPQVQLRWKISSHETTLDFYKEQLTVKEKDQSFDVTLISQYRVRDKFLEKLTVECEVVHSAESMFGFRMAVDLHFPKGDTVRKKPFSNSLRWIIPILLLFLILVVCGVFTKRCMNKKKKVTTQVSNNEEEMTSMLDENGTEGHISSEIKQQFLKQLQEKYKDLYDAVQPIPYIKDRLSCVNSLFVEGGIEYMSGKRGRIENWVRLDTYQNVLDDTRILSTRRIIEGEPGYGKSTIALQFAYDWCNSKESSPLKDVDVFILLLLRQLGGVTSIYRAIKRFMLPKDSQLSETNIRKILQDSRSVLIVLDGFDEYPDRDSSSSDVMSIINRKMFQEAHVILTTRLSILPPKCPPLTKRLRLTGFDKNARRNYIRKAVVGGNNDTIRKIEGYLKENPILSDLCQVPLLFVSFAHMAYEYENVRKLKSVTSFFRYMVSCFHSHMKNKMNDENVKKYKLSEAEHHNLDEMAFKAFNGPNPKLVWDKDEMCAQVGQELYDQYIRIGILVEEENVHITDEPHTPITEHIQYKTEVSFHHKLFCEWYAAHYLTYYIEQNSNLDLSLFLQNINPFDVQYLFRFSCGLNPNSSEKIINYLENIEGGDKFAILCIWEQTGNTENIMETIRRFCSEGIIISGHDSLLLQRSSMQLLEIAVLNDIPIKGVILHNWVHAVEEGETVITSEQNLKFHSNIPTEGLMVTTSNREISQKSVLDIFIFSSKCPSLRQLGLSGCPPPRDLRDVPILSSLQLKNITVKHFGAFEHSRINVLNLDTGLWEREEDGKKCTDEDFNRMETEWEQLSQWTEEQHKDDVEKDRVNLSILATQSDG